MKTKKANRNEVRETSITFPATVKEKSQIQKAADEMGVSMSAFIRMVINGYLKGN